MAGQLIVTPEQLALGYKTYNGLYATDCPFEILQKLENGNYVVRDPRPNYDYYQEED